MGLLRPLRGCNINTSPSISKRFLGRKSTFLSYFRSIRLLHTSRKIPPPFSFCDPYNMAAVLLVLGVTSAIMTPGVQGHGRMMDPPSRNSMWRLGFSNPVNYNDNELYCGGRVTQWARNKGKCGVCGDAYHAKREHEMGGKYANGILTRDYKQGDVINTTIHITANHRGYFEFRLCPVKDAKIEVTQRCLDANVLEREDGQGEKFYLPEGKSNQFFNISLRLPPDLTCERCVIQWKYRTGNTWDKNEDGEFCVGCGPQEEFYNCADVSIHPGSSGTKWRPRAGKVIRSDTSGKLSDYGLKKAGYLSQHANKPLNSPTTIFNDNLSGSMKESFKEKDLKSSIEDYNKLMYSHLFMGKKDLLLGPISEAFKPKARKQDAEEVNKVYSRFGYGNYGKSKNGNKSGNGRERGLNMEDKERFSRLQVQGQKQSSKLSWTPTRRINSDTPGAVSVYSQTLGSLGFKTDRANVHQSGSPFTPPPPNGDPDLLRIFPIHGSQTHHSVERNGPRSTKTKLVQAIPSRSNLHSSKHTLAIQESRQRKGKPRWLRKRLRNKRRRLESSSRKPSSNTNLVGYNIQTVTRNRPNDGQGKMSCQDNRFSPYCSRVLAARSGLFDRVTDNGKPRMNRTFYSYEQEEKGSSLDSSHVSQETSEGNEDNLEVLINFLTTLLGEQSKTKSDLKQNVAQNNDYIIDNQGHADLSESFSRTTSELNVERLNPPRLKVYQPQTSLFQAQPVSNFATSPESWSSTNLDGFIGTTHGAREIAEYQQTALQPKENRRRLFTQRNKDNDDDNNNIFRKQFGYSERSPYNRNGVIYNGRPDQSFDDDQNYRLREITDASADQITWESKTAQNNRKAMRKYRREMERASQRRPSNRVRTRARYRIRSNSRSRLNSAPNSRALQTYRHGYVQDQGDESSYTREPFEYKYSRTNSDVIQDFSPSNSQLTSQIDDKAYYPEPQPISIPDTETLNFENIPSRGTPQSFAGPQFNQPARLYNDRDVSQSQRFQVRSYGSIRSSDSNIYQQWRPYYKRQTNIAAPSVFLNSRTQNVLPPATTYPNPTYASAFLKTPLTLQYPTSGQSRYVCKSLITLSGGMDQWCSDNCHANFCPPSTCVCYFESELEQSAQPEDWRNPIAQLPSVMNYRQEYGRFGNVDNNNDVDFMPQVEELLEPLPLAIPQVSFQSSLISDAVPKRRTFGVADRVKVPTKNYNKNTRRRSKNRRPSNRLRSSYVRYPYLQNQDLALSQMYGISQPLRNTQNNDFRSRPTLLGNDRQRGPISSSPLLTHTDRFSRQKFPTQYLPKIIASTPFTPKLKGNNFYHNHDKFEYHTSHDQSEERTVPHQNLPYQTNRTLLRGEVSSTEPSDSKLQCEAIGAYSGIQHFDDWCEVTCKKAMCPLLLCSCKGHDYN